MESGKSQLKSGVILNYVNIILGNLIPIFYTPIMLSLLGQSEYGLYKISSSVTSYLSLISLGIGSAVTRYLIKYRIDKDKEGEEKILGLFVLIFQVIAVVALVVGTILTFNLQVWYGNSLTNEQLQRMRIIVFLMVCNTAISFSATPYVSVVNAHEEFIFQQSMNILSTCVVPIINLVVLWMGYASIGMAVSSLSINVLVQFFYLAYVKRRLKIKASFQHVPTKLIKEIFSFSFWIFVSNVVNQLYNATDTVMIGAIPALATEGAAVYSVGSTLNNIVLTATTGISNVLTPRTNRMVFSGASNDELSDFAIRIGRIQAYIISLIVTGFIAFGRPFIYFYAGEAYADAYWVAVLIMIPNMIPLVQSVCLNIVVAQNKHRFRSLVYLGIAIANVIGTWILMQYMGIIGAALMTSIALFVGTGLVMNWYYWKKIGLNIPKFWRQVGIIYAIPATLCVLTLMLSQIVDFYNIITMLSGIIIYTMLFVGFNWRLMMNQYEKDLLLNPLHKIFQVIKRKK